MKQTVTFLAMSVMACASFGNCAKADLILSFTASGDAGVFDVEVGSSVSIPVYIVQTQGETRLSTLGLFSAGATINYSYSSGAEALSTPESVSLASHWTDTLANFTKIDLETKQVTLEGLVQGVTAVKPVAGGNSILIGEISVTAGALGNVTQLTTSLDNNLPGINLLLTPPAGVVIAPSFSNARVNTIAAVPEPSSGLLLVWSASLFALRRRRPLLV